MLEIKDLWFRIAGMSLFSSASTFIPAGSKVGLVGRNGTGKTTLFKLIKDEYSLDSGKIIIGKSAKVGGVSQDVPNGADSLIDTVIQADSELISLLAEEKTTKDLYRVSEIQERLYHIDAYSAEARASYILNGLGFNHNNQKKSCNEFSGGWQMRVALASALFSAPDLLLLDEPTNYLDLEGSIWLQNFISKYPKTIILISHDRSILSSSVNKILHLENQKLTLFSGNYDFFIKSYSETKILNQSISKKEKIKKEHMQSFINRFRAKASKAKQAQSRLKALQKLKTNPPEVYTEVSDFYIPSPKELAPPIINLSGVSVGYDKNVILEDLNLRIDPTDRIALLGKNGQGKSTFSKLIAGKLIEKCGKITKSAKLRVGYFSQDLIDTLSINETAIQHIERKLPKSNRKEIISLLALGGISADVNNIPVRDLSGGQKARLAIALASVDAPHLLILDEPSNHLDIESREKLATNLNNFTGAILLISHDPYLINLVADDLWLVKNKKITKFDSDLSTYKKLLMTDNAANNTKKQIKEVQKSNFKSAVQSNRSLEKELEHSDRRIKRLQEMKNSLQTQFTEPSIYLSFNKAKLEKLKDKNIELDKAIELAEKIWLDIAEKMEHQKKN